MTTIVNPSREQIEQFCDTVRKHLLSALERGSTIELGLGHVTEDVFAPEFGYGRSPVDVRVVGAKFKAKINEKI